jgi:hypothetical protein
MEQPERISELGQLVKEYRCQVRERELGESLMGQEPSVRNLTLPLDLLSHIHLEKLADKLGRSKTAVAVDILSMSVRDVHVEVFGQAMTEPEIHDYLRKGANRSPAEEGQGPSKEKRPTRE